MLSMLGFAKNRTLSPFLKPFLTKLIATELI
jgi:hypothetical protein